LAITALLLGHENLVCGKMDATAGSGCKVNLSRKTGVSPGFWRRLRPRANIIVSIDHGDVAPFGGLWITLSVLRLVAGCACVPVSIITSIATKDE
jgi:hypothetical protein